MTYAEREYKLVEVVAFWFFDRAYEIFGRFILFIFECHYVVFSEPVEVKGEDAKTIYLSTLNVKDKNKYGHPTIKPLPLIRKLIRNSSKENDIVLDCFIGSGTTAVASILENRKFIGFEINKKYYDIALKRIAEANKEVNINE